jgi:hypothetical protein
MQHEGGQIACVQFSECVNFFMKSHEPLHTNFPPKEAIPLPDKVSYATGLYNLHSMYVHNSVLEICLTPCVPYYVLSTHLEHI